MVLRVTTSDYEILRVTTSGTTSDYEWLRVTTSGTTSDYEWLRDTTSDYEWYYEWLRDTTRYYEWLRVTTRYYEWYYEWLRIIFHDISFFFIDNIPYRTNLCRTKFLLDKIFVTSRKFRHFCPTNNFVRRKILSISKFSFLWKKLSKTFM